MMSHQGSLLDRDQGLLWHPYASVKDTALYSVHGAYGTRLSLESAVGTRHEVIDAMSSWWSVIHGYRNPVLDAALQEQASKFCHVMFGGLTHEPAIRLAEELVRLSPEPLRHVFLADSGSVSIEVALKLAVQFQQASGRPDRHRFVALRGGYHGDTTGAMSVCDPVDGMHSLFPGLVPQQIFLPRPPARSGPTERADDDEIRRWIATAEEVIGRHEGSVAAIVVEPLLQGTGGMHMYAPECLVALRRIADHYGLLLIADEIATGFGRTGTMFAVNGAEITPDVMCVGKALTGGYLSLAAVLCTSEVAQAVSESAQQALLHGPTFMGNPLACAVACASLELIVQRGPQQIVGVEQQLRDSLTPARQLDSVREVRVMGGVGVVQLKELVDVRAVTEAAVNHGVWVRPFRDLVYTMPPYISDAGEVATIGSAITAAIEQVHG